MARYLALGSLLALGHVVAANKPTTIDMIVPGWDPASVAASVVAVKQELTTVAVGCDNTALCGIPATIVMGSDTWSLSSAWSTGKQAFTYDYDCQVNTPKMTCTISMSGTYAQGATSRSTVDTTDNISELVQPITVTAGANKLKASPAASTTAADKTTVDRATAVTATAVESTAPKTAAHTAAESTAEPSAESTAGSTATATSSFSSVASAASTASSTAESTPSSDGGDDEGAAGPGAARNVLLAGAVALVGGAVLL